MSRSPSRRERRSSVIPPSIVRQVHGYLGLLIAPSVLFFAVTGALQLFSLHEAHGGYQPPPLIEKLGELHKKQHFAAKPVRAAPDARRSLPGAAPARAPKPTPMKDMMLKWVFLFVAAGLTLSTLLGLWMSLAQGRRKVMSWLCLIVGLAVPLAILLS